MDLTLVWIGLALMIGGFLYLGVLVPLIFLKQQFDGTSGGGG